MTERLEIIASNKFKKPLFSKWQKLQVLLDPIEMENLLRHLSPLFMFNISEVIPFEKISLPLDTFMNDYQKYIDMLRGKIPKQKIVLTYALSQRIENFCAIAVSPNQFICRALQPDIHLQAYEFLLDSEGKILPQVFSPETISWGIQFAYPAIFQDAYTMEVFPATRASFLGWKVFSCLRNWLRRHSMPLRVQIKGNNIYLPIRLGKKAADWIDEHIDRAKIAISENIVSKICQKQTF